MLNKLKDELIRKYNKFCLKQMKSCKVCGSRSHMSGYGGHYMCVCSKCGNSGELKTTKIKALINWNQNN